MGAWLVLLSVQETLEDRADKAKSLEEGEGATSRHSEFMIQTPVFLNNQGQECPNHHISAVPGSNEGTGPDAVQGEEPRRSPAGDF